MKITYTPPVKATDKTRKKSGSSSTSDADFEGFLGGADEASATSGTQAASGVNTFLFMQEVSDEEVARQRAMQHGKQVLQGLEQLHRDLLMGTVPLSTLSRLQSTIDRQRETFTDPRLKQILDEIELRAAVELAKLERAQSQN